MPLSIANLTGARSLLCATALVISCNPSAREPQTTEPATSPTTPAVQHPDPAEPIAPAAPGIKVAFLGDSIAAGLHLPADEAFPAVLQRRLKGQGHDFALVNAGVSGDTSAGGLRRLDWLLKQRPQVLVIELGGNDGLRAIPLATIETNLRAIITRTKDAGVVPLLLGVRLPPNYGAEYVGGFEALYPRLAAELDVQLVPFFMQGVGGNPQLNLEDGMHPTTAGHERLADNVEPALRELLAKLR